MGSRNSALYEQVEKIINALPQRAVISDSVAAYWIKETIALEGERAIWHAHRAATIGGSEAGEFPLAALAAARAEAEAAFGDPTLLLERFTPRARHLEVQILGDRHGTVLHLLERDCSLQRKHQKLIEEAPAPNLPDALRRSIRDRALALARAIGYYSAGTVEFLYDPDSGEAWFLEMNTRLQVEHPVTEAITGLDIAAWQIRIAAGEALDLKQEDIQARGWAIEARVAAEDPSNDYAPCTGTLSHWRPPHGPGLRVDSGVRAGSGVGHHYDSMLAKIIAHGGDREQARRRLRRALGGLESAGVALNTAFLRDLLELPDFVAGRQHTELINENWPAGWKPRQGGDDLLEAALADYLSSPGPAAGPWRELGAWRVTEAAGRPGTTFRYVRDPEGELHLVRLRGRGGHYTVEREEGRPIEVDHALLGDDRLEYEVDGVQRRTGVIFDHGKVTLLRPGGGVALSVLAPEAALLGAAGSGTAEGDILAPMPGAVVEITVEPGQAVRAGDTICVLEAMKLFQELTAPFDGTVAEIRASAGETVAGGALLAVVTPAQPSKLHEPEAQI
ncbi:MAG TPA: biotin/lipoyl-containing protein [Arenicellales bacterium]|nr:biotin/lipoyl-containing protein [Arenicellales bacterium]